MNATDFLEKPLGQSRTASPMFEASGLNPSAKGWSTREVSNLLISLIKTAPHLLASSGFWLPHQDSNLKSTASKAGMLPLHHKAMVRDAGAGFEPAFSTFREWRLYLFVYPAIIAAMGCLTRLALARVCFTSGCRDFFGFRQHLNLSVETKELLQANS
jgi:hypothetical protein